MKKITIIILGVGILVGALYASAFVRATTNTPSAQELIQSLQEQIAKLKTQIETLRQARLEAEQTEKEVKGTLKLIKQMRKGMSGEEVKLLQEVLATDSDIYPEGLITGYFGSLTEKAVKRFQQLTCIEQVGFIGPKTIAKINELLKEGAGSSGKVPPGLLIAPGIRKKLCFAPEPLPGQELPPGIAKKLDTTPPLISDIIATASSSSAEVTWRTDEKADSKVWYQTLTPLVISGSTPLVSSSDLVLNHKIVIFSLTPSTDYYYKVGSTDIIGNATTSTEQCFRTFP